MEISNTINITNLDQNMLTQSFTIVNNQSKS